MLHRLSVDGFSIVLDRTRFDNAKRTLGGTVGSSGDAGDAERWLCFHGSDAGGPWVFWLTSGEINGDAIGGYVWKRVGRQQPIDPRCGLLHHSDPIHLQLPMRLGMTNSEATKVLGTPTSDREPEYFYMRDHNQVIHGIRYTISNGIEVYAHDGMIVQIAAFETSSD